MATITASGKTVYGKINIEITGGESVREIRCNSDAVKNVFAKDIANAVGEVANAYHPKGNTMLQALVYCQNVFGEKNVHVDGYIEPLESEEGVIY